MLVLVGQLGVVRHLYIALQTRIAAVREQQWEPALRAGGKGRSADAERSRRELLSIQPKRVFSFPKVSRLIDKRAPQMVLPQRNFLRHRDLVRLARACSVFSTDRPELSIVLPFKAPYNGNKRGKADGA